MEQAGKRKVWKRVWAFVLSVALIFGLSPENSFVAHAQEEGEACICTELCTEGSVNADCPVCAAEGADIGLCEGTEVTEPDEIEPEKTESEEPGSKAANSETADKLITAWQWVDEEEILDPETGSLALPGASKDVPALFADVTNLLPTEIKAVLKVTVQNGEPAFTDNEGDETAADRGEAAVEEVEQTVALGKWECADYPEAGAYSGSYTFTASLPEGYRLNDHATPIEVTVELGGAEMYGVADGVSYVDEGGVVRTTTGDVTTVESSTTGWSSGWYYVDRNTTISSRIGVSGNVHLILGDDCTLTASSGINVSAWNSLTIYGQSNGTGTLTATAAASTGNSAIGGNAYKAAGTIVINGGNVNATALKDAATGIGGGGGYGGKAGTITINGGTVNATGSYWNAGIGGGTNEGAGNITINGGIITAQSGGNGNSGGIGCGSSGDGGSITINGGTITATGAYSGIGGEGFQNDSTTTSTFIVNGGSINGTLSNITPKNKDGEVVRLGKLNVSGISSEINSVSVDGKPYYIEAKHAGNDYLYLYMVSGEDHTVTIRDSGGTITTWTATYNSSGNGTDGYFTFQQVEEGSTSVYATTLAFDQAAYSVNRSQADSMVVKVTVQNSTQTNSLPMSLRRIAMDSMALYVMQGEKIMEEYTNESGSPYTFSVDVRQLAVGKYTLKAVYGGSSDGAESSERTAALTICKTLDSPQSLAWSSTTYGRATWNAVTNATGYSAQLYKDGTAVGDAVSTTGQSCDFTIAEVGDYTFTVKAIGDGTYYVDSGEVTSSSLIRKQAQITVESGKSTYTKIYGDPAFDLEGISHDNTDANVKLGYTVNNSKNAVGAIVNNDAVVTVDENGKVTIRGAGTATITVSLPASTHFAAAESVDITIKVEQRAVVLQSDSRVIKQDASLTYGESLSELSLNDEVVFVAEGTNTVVQGTLAWEAPDRKPTSAGTINAGWKFIPNDANNYKSLSDSEEITVNPATPKITWETTVQNVAYTGSEINSGKLTVPTVELTNGETYNPGVEGTSPITYSFRPSGSTESYTAGLPTAIGTYEVKAGVDAFGNYAAADSTSTMTLTINWLQGVEDATLQDQGGASLSGDSWWAQTVKLIAPEHYTIGWPDEIENDTTIEYQTETGKTGKAITYYLKNADGEIAKKEVTVYVDRTAPKGSITIKNTTWDQLLSTITFGFYVPKNEVVTVGASDTLSGVKTTEYVISGDPYTEISNVQALSGWQTYHENNQPKITNTEAESYVYVRITDQAGNITYLSSAGILADDRKPTDTNISTSAVTDSTATVTVTASDTGSGVAAYYLYYTADSTEIVTADTVKSKDTANGSGVFSLSGLQADKTYYLYAVAEDGVGNLSEVKMESFSTALSGFTVTCSATADSITVTPLANQEKYGTVMYRLGTDGTWQTSNEFTGLSADTTYTVYAKYTGNAVYSESHDEYATVKTKKWATVIEPTGLIATYGNTLNDIELPSNWTWTSADTKVAVGEQQYEAKFTQIDTESFDYSKIEGFDAGENCVYRTLTVTVSKADPEIGRVTVTPETVRNTTAVTAVTLSRENVTVSGELKLDESVLSYSNGDNKVYHWTFTPTDAANYETKHGTVFITVEDTIAPSAKYQIGTDGWKKFVNTITFGLFCKDYKTVEIAYSDLNGNEEEGSGLKTKQYYISDRELSDADIQSIQWKDYTKALSLDAQGVYFIYMKVVDHAGNTVIQNSEGIVIYKDSTPAAAELTYTYQENADKTVSVTLNGNTVKDIKNGTDVLVKDTDYTVGADGTITFKAAYLQTLSAGDYTLTVSYNPQGKEYQENKNDAGNDFNDAPATTAIHLTVQKAAGTVTITGNPGKIYDGSPAALTTSQYTTNNTSGTAKIEYKVQGAADSAYTTDAPKNAGDYTVRVTVQADGNYTEAVSDSVDFTIDKKELTVTVKVEDKQYDGLNTAAFDGTPTLQGVVAEDQVILTDGVPTFTSVEAGANILISFTDFTISGDDAGNYTLTQPSGVKANITNSYEVARGTEYSVNYNDWIKTDFVITANAGYELSETNTADGTWSDTLTASDETEDGRLAFYVRNKANGAISKQVTESYMIDKTAPEGDIEIRENHFKSFLNDITFGLFFKNNVDVTITASDKGTAPSGIRTIEYQKVAEGETCGENGTWSNGDRLSVTENEAFVLYARITDKAGNTTIINSNGVVVYTDAAQKTADITYTRTTKTDVTAEVTLNGNTIDKVTISSAGSMEDAAELTNGSDYTLNPAGDKITFKGDYLDKLPAGDYTITVSYKPLGKEYQTGGLNEAPNTTAIALKVVKADVPAIQDVDRNYVYAAGSKGETVSIDIAALLPEDRGTTTYALAENHAPYVVDEAVDGDGTLTYQVDTTGSATDSTTLTVTATTENYKDITVNIYIILIDKYVTAEKAGAEVRIDGSDKLTYGQKVGELALNTSAAKFIAEGTETEVTGTLAWTNPDEVLNAGTNEVQWTFTPDDRQTYEVLTGKVTIIVNKKAPEIVWDATALTIGYTGNPAVSGQMPEITVTLVNGEAFDAAENPIHYSYRKSGSTGDFTEGLPIEIGTYEVKAGIAAFGNYADAESTDTMTLTINWLQNTPDAILKDQDEVVLSGNSWWARSISLTAPENYTISTDLTGAYGASIAYQEETGTDGAEVTYYLKNDAGEIAEKKTVVRIDQTAPTGSITIKNTIWDSLLKVITVGFYVPKNEVVTISSSDTRSGVQKTEYVISGEAYTSLTDVQGLTGWQDYRADNKPKLTDTSGENYVYARITDNAGNAIYVSSDGVLVDDVAPTDVSIAASEITQNSATVTVTADDAGSGVSSYYLYYTVDHAADVTVDMIKDSDITNTTGSFSLSGLKDNTTYSVYAVAEDHIGNCSEIATESFKTKAKAYENSSGGGSSGNSAGMPSGDEKPKSEDDSASKDQPDEKTQAENALVMNKTAKLTWKNDVFAIKWGTVENAEGYDIYATTCGKKFTSKSKVASVTEEQTSATIEEVLGSQVSPTRGYKVMVKAYRMADGKKQYLGKSMEFYTVGTGHKTYTNASAITPSVRTLTLTTGKTKKVSATITKEDKKKKLLPGKYTASKRYFTADETIATVDEKGNVTALKKGKTTLYIKAANGVTAKVQIIIK
ncbi:MAG: X2-like carbohydrate binding domain-containing protein [bacterium]|nr:X2-like carbohydrate binding domain-containing protein [bacterium]